MKTEKDIEEILDNVKIPSDEEVEAAGMRFDRRIRRLSENVPSDRLEREFRGSGVVLWARVCLVVGT